MGRDRAVVTRRATPGLGVRLLAALTLLAAVLAVPGGPAAADARSDQAEVRRNKVQAAAKLDVLKASDQEVQQALDALDASVVGTTDQVGEAAQAESRAALAAQAADRQLAAGEERLRGALAGLRSQAVNAYTTPVPAALELSAGATPADISRSMVYADVRTGQSADKLDQVRAARSDLAAARRRASRAAGDASRLRAATEARLNDLEQMQAAQASVADSLEAKVAANEKEVDQLASSDTELSAAIARQDAEAAARRRAELLALQAAENERAARLTPPPTRAPAAAPGAADPTSRLSNLAPGILPSIPGPPRPVATAPAGPGLSTVRGITVSSSIAGQLASLLAASDRAGLSLSGGGYRSSQGQIETRRNNCGSSSYDIYEKPASSCSPPTAKPGASMHERGLAIDFTNRGSTISSHSNPAFVWLAANAGSFGFSNLPSEPWHWSTNGN